MGGVDHGCRLYCFAMRSNKKEKNLQFRIDSGGKVRYIWLKKKKKKCTSEREEPLISGSSQLSLKIDQTSWQKMKRHIPPFFFFFAISVFDVNIMWLWTPRLYQWLYFIIPFLLTLDTILWRIFRCCVLQYHVQMKFRLLSLILLRKTKTTLS